MICLSHNMYLRPWTWILTQDHLTSEDMTGMGFDPNNYSPIPPVANAALQQPGAALPTSTPRSVEGTDFNTSDPIHNRGKAKIINSFTES